MSDSDGSESDISTPSDDYNLSSSSSGMGDWNNACSFCQQLMAHEQLFNNSIKIFIYYKQVLNKMSM